MIEILRRFEYLFIVPHVALKAEDVSAVLSPPVTILEFASAVAPAEGVALLVERE